MHYHQKMFVGYSELYIYFKFLGIYFFNHLQYSEKYFKWDFHVKIWKSWNVAHYFEEIRKNIQIIVFLVHVCS